MIPLINNPNVDKSDLQNYPGGRISDNTGANNGTPINRSVYGDIHSNISKLLRLYDITPSDVPDNETNGYDIIKGLIALASKNDFLLPITASSGVLVVPIKLGKMQEGEQVMCKSNVLLGTETQIKGLDNVTFNFVCDSSFKVSEYVMLTKTSVGITLVRLVDALNLDAVSTELKYLKAASNTIESTGTSEAVATTPKSNLFAFIKRVIGADSANYLATASANGLYPKEHYYIVANLASPTTKNIGFVTGIDVNAGNIGSTYPVGGDIISATLTAKGGAGNTFRVVFKNDMGNTNYMVKSFVQSISTNLDNDEDIAMPVFQPSNKLYFDFRIREVEGVIQNIKIHFEVVSIIN